MTKNLYGYKKGELIMKTLVNNFVSVRNTLIVEERDVLTVLRVLDGIKNNSKLHKWSNMEIGSCDWSDEPTKWFVSFTVTRNQWRLMIRKLHNEDHGIILKEDNQLYLV